MKAHLLFFSITAVAVILACYAVGSINPVGIYPTGWSDAQIIRDRCRLRLVQPESVSSNGSVLMNWLKAEIQARVAVIALFWLGAMGFAIRFELCGNENMDSE